jgi:hypothetical protein
MFVDLIGLVNGQETKVTVNTANVTYFQETALHSGAPATRIYFADANVAACW